MGISEKLKQAVNKTDVVIQNAEKKYLDNRSELGEQQKQKIAEAKKEYFSNEYINSDWALRKTEKKLGALGVKIYNTYLPYVREVYTPSYEVPLGFNVANRITYFDIMRWVNDTEEKNIEKLTNVYQVLANEKCNIALIYNRKQNYCKVTLAIANTGESSMLSIASDYKERVIEAIRGNFPGAEIKITDSNDSGYGRGIPECLQNIVTYKDEHETELVSSESVAIITNLATDKSEDFISQSMEKLLDGIVPETEEQEYKLILLACPADDIDTRKNILYDMYNELSPYASWQESFSALDNTSIGAGSSLGKNVGGNVGFHGNFLGAKINGGVNFGVNFGKTANYSVTVGNNKGQTKTCTNYAVKHSLELLEEQIKRLEQCSSLGMWRFAAYAVSQDPVMVNNVATMYLALTQGEKSYLSNAAINFWHGTKEKEAAAVILETLKRIQHPHFILQSEVYKEDCDILMFPNEVDMYTLISGKELVRALNFPRKSVAGFPVIESVSFGREVQKFTISCMKENELPTRLDTDGDKNILDIGNVVHMYRAEKQRVQLDVDSFTSHVFVTGSTGTGKSNAIYQLLSGFLKIGKKVLVIEPAKGEYRMALGKYFKTYGTNPKLSELLRINPFVFPTGGDIRRPVHVLEHIDRLTEILNACWPMYAAMPAVLKDAIELAYINKGWNLYSSECYPLRFPTFADLLTTLPEVMNNSLYSKDTQSDYAGALVTRIKSLTNGINGLVMCADEELSNEELFESNVIVDISRVGSMETKAMLMGVLVMKLEEYHMSSSGTNEKLQHITVIEEAHNLLRGIPATQGQDSGNLQGKSVEMITNSIAEMRTYGEGFIIVDQAPGLLDEAVIRNTNTKIIFRLPDKDDRELVGKAASLSDTQINELARLPRGVAAVYQNDWVEAVLCQFEKYANNYELNDTKFELPKVNRPTEDYLEILFNVREKRDMQKEEVECISNWINRQSYPTSMKEKLRRVLAGGVLSEREMESVAYNLFEGKRLAKYLRDSIDESDGIEGVDIKIRNMYDIESNDLVVTIRQLVLQYITNHVQTDSFEKRYIDFIGRRQM